MELVLVGLVFEEQVSVGPAVSVEARAVLSCCLAPSKDYLGWESWQSCRRNSDRPQWEKHWLAVQDGTVVLAVAWAVHGSAETI